MCAPRAGGVSWGEIGASFTQEGCLDGGGARTREVVGSFASVVRRTLPKSQLCRTELTFGSELENLRWEGPAPFLFARS